MNGSQLALRHDFRDSLCLTTMLQHTAALEISGEVATAMPAKLHVIFRFAAFVALLSHISGRLGTKQSRDAAVVSATRRVREFDAQPGCGRSVASLARAAS